MKHLANKAAVWLGRLTLAAGLALAAAPAWADSEQEQRQRLEALKQAMESLRKELRSVKTDRDQLLNDLEDSEKAIGDLNAKVKKLKKELEQREQRLNQLHNRQQELEHEKQQQQSHVSEHINAAYRLGQQSNLRMLLNQQDPSLVARNMKYFAYLTRARTAKIDHYLATLDELGQVEQAINLEATQLRADHEQLSQRHKQLAQRQRDRTGTLQKLEATIANKDQRLQQMTRDQQQLEQLLRRVAQALEDVQIPADAGEFSKLKGQLAWPAKGKLSRKYGAPRIAGKVNWQGVVINAEAGSPVTAIHHGRVVFADYLRGHGLLLIIDHGTGFMSLYARNQALYKEIGEWVDAGEVIASVGNSGGQDTASLYFELRHNGRPTDPQQWIRAG